jgi:NAD(P)-dependent dehydrogenase (short-subunit alcohol dehydrogenase family)
MSDRSAIGNSGLGQESVLQLAKHNPSRIFLASRSTENAQASINTIRAVVPNANITILPLDLASLESVKDAANIVNATTDRLDILMNNAGIMATPPGTTKEGYEIQFGVNHVGHALLTKLLLPKLEATAQQPGTDVRIITLSSVGHMMAPKGGVLLDDVHSEMKSINTVTRYGQSKLANILYSNELAKRYPKIRCISVHPGSVDTGLKRGLQSSYPWLSPFIPFISVLFTNSVQQGALNQLWAATSGDAKSGKYYVPVAKESPGSALAQDKELGERLWKWTEGEMDKFLATK